MIPKKFSHCWEVLGPTTDFPTCGSGKCTEYPQGTWLWRIWLQNFHRTGETETLGGHKQNLMHTRTQEKGAVTPQETDPDLPVRVWESLAEAWVISGLPLGQGHWLQQSWEAWHADISPFKGSQHYCHYPYHSLASGSELQWGNTAPPINGKLDKDLLSTALPTRARRGDYMTALLQRKGMIPSSQLWFSQVTEKFTGAVEAKSSHSAVVP